MRRRVQTKNRIKQFWTGLFISVLFLLLWVHRTVQSTQLSYQIQNLEGEMRKEQNKQIELKMERDRYLSLEFIESVAIKNLGLVVPKEENIVVFTLIKPS